MFINVGKIDIVLDIEMLRFLYMLRNKTILIFVDGK
jgi:hypothetical protein